MKLFPYALTFARYPDERDWILEHINGERGFAYQFIRKNAQFCALVNTSDACAQLMNTHACTVGLFGGIDLSLFMPVSRHRDLILERLELLRTDSLLFNRQSTRLLYMTVNGGIIHLELQGLPTVPVNAIRAISHGFEIQGEGNLVRHSPS